MDEMVLQEKPGFFSRFANVFSRPVVEEDDFEYEKAANPKLELRAAARYTVTVRRQITNFDDAIAAAHGLKRGEQQVLNLTGTESSLRQKIVDFMCGVNFSQEGTWEEIGENIYLIVPMGAFVEVEPATPRSNAHRN